jgi:hypothetical protein
MARLPPDASMIVGSLLAFVLPAAACLVLLMRGAGQRRAWPWCVPVAAGLGVGFSTLVWPALLLTLAPGRPVGTLVVIDAVLWTAAIGGAWLLFRRSSSPSPRLLVRRRPGEVGRGEGKPSLTWISAAAVVALAVISGGAFIARTIVFPHGTGDAWAIWNLHARFLFRGYPTAWIEGISMAPDWSHPDYPLLLPLAVAREWSYAGGEHVLLPAITAALFWIATIATAAGAVSQARGVARGLITAAVLLCSPALMNHGSTQCADVPLAFFILAAFVLAAAADESDDRVLWVLSGLSAGLAAWTKNEGLAFCSLFFGVSTWWAIRRDGVAGWKRLALLLAGAAAPLATVAIFKTTLAPASYLVREQSMADAVAKLADFHRFTAVGTAMLRDLWFGGAPWIGVLPIVGLFLCVRGIRLGGSSVPALAALAGLGLPFVYALVYLVTPKDLAWQLTSSSDRLVLHVMPLFVWVAMTLADSGTNRTA